MAEEELKYTSDYSGEATDEILAFSDKIRQQTEAGDGETVQVYDTDGNPHKVAKEELLKKSALALPSLNDISAFVAINQAGDAVGIMSKEQVATVLGELIGINSAFMLRGRQNFDDFDNAEMGIWELYSIENLAHKPDIGNYGILLCYWSNDSGRMFRLQLAFPRTNVNLPQFRARNDTNQAWSAWRTFSLT